MMQNHPVSSTHRFGSNPLVDFSKNKKPKAKTRKHGLLKASLTTNEGSVFRLVFWILEGALLTEMIDAEPSRRPAKGSLNQLN